MSSEVFAPTEVSLDSLEDGLLSAIKMNRIAKQSNLGRYIELAEVRLKFGAYAKALFATADSLLLAPHDLDSGRLQAVFGDIMTHRVDYADLYFQYTRSESWSLEEGIVKSGSFKYALYDPQTKRMYLLSDQKTPEQFAAQRVKVTGILYPKTGVIKVEKIEPAK